MTVFEVQRGGDRGRRVVVEAFGDEPEDEFVEYDEPEPSIVVALLLIVGALVLTYVAVPLFT